MTEQFKKRKKKSVACPLQRIVNSLNYFSQKKIELLLFPEFVPFLFFYVSRILCLLCIIEVLVLNSPLDFSLYSLPHPPDSTFAVLVISLRSKISPFIEFPPPLHLERQPRVVKYCCPNMVMLLQKDIKELQLKFPFSQNYHINLHVIEQLVRFSIPGTLFTIT